MVASDFDGLRGYRTLEYEGQVPTKPYNCCFCRVFQASVCIATYGMSVPSLHTESTDSVIMHICKTYADEITMHTKMLKRNFFFCYAFKLVLWYLAYANIDACTQSGGGSQSIISEENRPTKIGLH